MMLSSQCVLTKQGKLQITLTEPVQLSFRYRRWSEGLQVERWDEGTWEAESIDFGLPLVSLANQSPAGSALSQFVSDIPSQIRQAVVPYTYCQTLLLQWLSISVYARQLFSSAPNLCWLLIVESHEKHWAEVEVCHALTLPREEILRRLTGQTSRACLKMLERIELIAGNYTEYRALKRSLRHFDRIRQLNTLTAVPIHLVFAADRYPWMAGSQLFRMMQGHACTHMTDTAALLREPGRYWDDAINVANLIGIQDAAVALKRCRDTEAIKRLHDRWTNRLNQQKCIVTDGVTRFPDPPVPGNAFVYPITTHEDLRAEGRLMHHCVASYESAVMAGRSYIYRMLEPQRVTIELKIRGKRIELGQVRLAYNRYPGEDTIERVYAWLEPYKHWSRATTFPE